MGNLAIGVVTADMLKELFNTILANQVPDPVNAPPVVNVNLDTSGAWEQQARTALPVLHDSPRSCYFSTLLVMGINTIVDS